MFKKLFYFILFFVHFTVFASVFDDDKTSNKTTRSSRQKKGIASEPSNKKLKKRRAKKRLSQWAYVKNSNAAIYQFASFDAPIIESFPYQKKVRISTKIYKGIGGLGAFYKVRIKRKVFGYITDVDVSLKPVGGVENGDQGDENSDSDQDAWSGSQFNDDTQGQQEPFFLTPYMGIGIANIKYSETINKTTELGSINVLGMNYSGPTGLFGGFPLDIDVYFSSQAPSFYDYYFDSASGLLMHTSASIMVPAVERDSWMIYYMGGITVVYTKFDVVPSTTPNNPAIDSQELKAGPLLGLGAAIRFNRFAIRASAKYYYEIESYLGFGGSVQYQF